MLPSTNISKKHNFCFCLLSTFVCEIQVCKSLQWLTNPYGRWRCIALDLRPAQLLRGWKKKSGAKSQRVKSIMRDRNPNPMKLGTHLRHLTLEQSMYRTRMVLKQYLSQYVTKIRVQSKIFLFCFIVWTFTEMSTYMSFCHSSSLSVALF